MTDHPFYSDDGKMLSLKEIKEAAVRQAVQDADGDRVAAARLLSVAPSTIYTIVGAATPAKRKLDD